MIFIKFNSTDNTWKKNKQKNEWKKKKRSLLECLFQKRVIYTQVNWKWNIDTRHLIPCFPSHISHYTYQLGQSYFQYLFHPSYNTRAIQFLVIPFLSPYQDKQSLTQISSLPCTYKLGQLQSLFPFMKSPLHYPYFLLNQVAHTVQA